MPAKLHIDFISDIACPWCVIGLRGLLKALEELKGEVEAEIRFWPFELNPDIGPEGENTAEHVARKYGSTRERSDAVREVIKQQGEALGFTFKYGPESRIWNTFDAHRLLAWALTLDKQLPLKMALFKSNFTDQRPTNDVEALVDAAREAGLDADAAREALTSSAFADEVRAEEEFWRSKGIHAVPSLIFNQRWLIQGAQPPEVFVQAMRDIVSGAAREA